MSITQFPRVIAALARGALRSIAGMIRRGLERLGLVNAIRRTFGPLNSTEASSLIRLTRDYLAAGMQQNALPPGASLNPANVPSVTMEGLGPQATGSVQFDTRINWHDPTTGRNKWLPVLIDSLGLLTNLDLAAKIDQAFSDHKNRPGTPESDQPSPSASIIGYSVYGVAQA